MMAVIAYVLFKVSSGTEREVCQKLVEFDEVVQADIVLEEFVSEKVRNVPDVLVTSTMIISREYRGKNNRPKTS
jgi:hypothetical protein